MTHRATLRLVAASPAQATRLASSLAADDDGFVRFRVEGSDIIAEAAGTTPLGLLRTLDEVLASLGAAQKAEALADR